MTTPGQVAVGLFDGSQGQRITLVLTNVTMGGTYTVFAPDGSVVTNGNIANNAAIAVPALPAAGTYSLYLIPGSSVGSATVNFQTDATGVLPTSGTPTPLSLAIGQNATYTFTGLAGQSYSLEMTQFASTPGNRNVSASILNPDGTNQTNCGTYAAGSGNCDFTLSASGTYSAHLVPNGLFAASFNLLLNQDLTATLTAGTPGPTVNVGLIPGQHGLLQLSATAGQTVALYVAPVTITPSNSSLTATVYGPTGAYVTSTNVTGSVSGTLNLTNLAAGSYSVLLAPNNASASGASTQVALANGVTVAMPVNGSSAAFQTYLPGQNGYFTFAATAGQNLGFGLTQLALTPASVAYASTSITTQNGTFVTSATCYTSASPGCELNTRNLPVTGTYTVTVSPGGQATMAAALTVSQDAGGTLTLNNASSIALSAPGEAADFTFTVASQQAVLLNVGSISTSPAGTAVIFYIYDSNNNLVTQASLTQSGSVNIGNVAAGTYTVLVVPNSAATANIQVTLQPAATGTLPANGASTNFGTTTAGQDAYLTFAGTAGQSVSLALTGLSLTPSSISSATVTVKKPDGTSLPSTSCSAANVGCELHLANLPQTGSYTVIVAPGGQATMNFAATLSTDVTGTLSSGTAFNVGLAYVGQSATLSFTQPSQQTMALDLGSISTTPANATLNVYVYNSSQTLVPGRKIRPGRPPARASDNAGAYTLLNWSVSSICDCTGNGGEFKEFKVDFEANAHIKADLPPNILAWAVRGEGDHIKDAMQWGTYSAKNTAQFMEDNFRGQSFSSISECQSKTTQALDTALKSDVPLEYETSTRLWDLSGAHQWGNPHQRP